MEEKSLDPRMLGAALLEALRAKGIEIHAGRRVSGVRDGDGGVSVETAEGAVRAGCFVDCTGAWSHPPIAPKKGQMLSVELQGRLEQVLRTPEVYLVPRRIGPQAGRVVIGATVEDAGFDTTTRGEDIARLHALASELLPMLAEARIVEQWAGLRPGTPDDLPMLGLIAERRFLAAGHFRNGILLAPATARLMAQMVMGEVPEIGVAAFSPERFAGLTSTTAFDIRPSEP
jgi:glycine oxidase